MHNESISTRAHHTKYRAESAWQDSISLLPIVFFSPQWPLQRNAVPGEPTKWTRHTKPELLRFCFLYETIYAVRTKKNQLPGTPTKTLLKLTCEESSSTLRWMPDHSQVQRIICAVIGAFRDDAGLADRPLFKDTDEETTKRWSRMAARCRCISACPNGTFLFLFTSTIPNTPL